MAVYEALALCVKYKYKAQICSKATLFLLVTSVLTFIIPLLIAYRSSGFWLRTATYREQPMVKFKHEYLLLLETDRLDLPVICSTFTQLQHILPNLKDCSMVKSREVDNNRDGKNDELFIEFHIPLENTDGVYAVKLFLLFDYRLYKVNALAMDSLGYIQHSSSLPGSRFDVAADLRLVQKDQLSRHSRNSKYNKTIIDGDAITMGDFDIFTILKEYASRNLSTHLSNIYPVWTPGWPSDEPFTVSATIFYPEDTITYRPSFWQVTKWAWIQYLALLVVAFYINRRITEFVFENQLVSSLRIEPHFKRSQ